MPTAANLSGPVASTILANEETVSFSLGRELVQIYARQGWRLVLPVFFAAGLIASLSISHVPLTLVVCWYAAVVLSMIFRRYVVAGAFGFHSWSTRHRLRLSVFTAALNGCVQALSVPLFFDNLPSYSGAMQLVMLGGCTVGTIGSSVGFRPVLLAYTAPVCLALLYAAASVAASTSEGYNGVTTMLVYVSSVGLVVFWTVFVLSMGSEHFRLQRQVFAARKQMSESNKKLVSALSIAESANSAKTHFLASASHDLRQPLHALSLFTNALSLQDLNQETRRISTHIEKAVSALGSQLDALLDISKLDAGVVEIEPDDVDGAPLIKRLYSEFSIQAKNKSLNMNLQIPSALNLHTDLMYFERLLSNLLSNAIRYTEQGEVSVTAEHRGDHVIVRVKDTGIGIPEGEREQIFSEFYQLHNSERDRDKGLGLGLAIVSRLAALLSIHIELKSELGVGSEFILSIPRALRNAVPVEKRNAAPSRPLKEMVLVVDDEAEVAEGMRTLLKPLGCDVLLADSVSSAVKQASANSISIILADYRLRGGETGVDVVASVRSILPGVPAIIISGDTAPESLLHVQNAELTMLHKPLSLEALRHAIHKELHGASSDSLHN